MKCTIGSKRSSLIDDPYFLYHISMLSHSVAKRMEWHSVLKTILALKHYKGSKKAMTRCFRIIYKRFIRRFQGYYFLAIQHREQRIQFYRKKNLVLNSNPIVIRFNFISNDGE